MICDWISLISLIKMGQAALAVYINEWNGMMLAVMEKSDGFYKIKSTDVL